MEKHNNQECKANLIVCLATVTLDSTGCYKISDDCLKIAKDYINEVQKINEEEAARKSAARTAAASQRSNKRSQPTTSTIHDHEVLSHDDITAEALPFKAEARLKDTAVEWKRVDIVSIQVSSDNIKTYTVRFEDTVDNRSTENNVLGITIQNLKRPAPKRQRKTKVIDDYL